MLLLSASGLAALAVARIAPPSTRVRHVGRTGRHAVVAPALTIRFPASRGRYAQSTWGTGCARGLGACGTVRYVRGLRVTVAIRQLATGRYWNGRVFAAGRPVYRRARLSRRAAHGQRPPLASWYYRLALPGPVGGYTIRVRASTGRHQHTHRLAQRSVTFAVELSSVPPSPAPPAPTPPAGPAATFSIAGNATGQLYPGGAAQSIGVQLSNPAANPIYVTSLSTSLDSTALPTGCGSTNFNLTQAVLPSGGLEIPAGATVSVAGTGATPPSIQMNNTGADQNACAGAHLTLAFAGSAHS